MMEADGSVMVVDDDEDIREIVKLSLEAAGFRVTTAVDGLEAWQHLNANAPPSLILLDLMMPRMDGEEFIKTLRASRQASIPVVIMSGHGASNQKAQELRANGYLTKPVELDELLGTVRRVVLSNRLGNQQQSSEFISSRRGLE
jgi:DNA-binding response OmpR family regulator